ncbi:MAG: Acyl-CoA dehydrogenase, partial [uncultured Solirubrobacteraceae bacterium]
WRGGRSSASASPSRPRCSCATRRPRSPTRSARAAWATPRAARSGRCPPAWTAARSWTARSRP